MKEKPIFPLLLSMSLPMVISMAVNSLYNIVDSYFKDYWSAKHGAIRVFKSNARETWCVILVSES